MCTVTFLQALLTEPQRLGTADIRNRADYLKVQRDRLLQMKMQEREKQLQVAKFHKDLRKFATNFSFLCGSFSWSAPHETLIDSEDVQWFSRFVDHRKEKKVMTKDTSSQLRQHSILPFLK